LLLPIRSRKINGAQASLVLFIWGVSAAIGVAGVKLASVALSLNASFMFAGFALGAVMGSTTIAHASPAALGFVGAASIVGALILASAIMREKTAAARAELQLATTKQL
jgi:predicted MFS family arabinose efflux permease